MEPAPSFPELIRRVRAGDEEAAAELVRDYGPQVRRAIRLRLTDPRLRKNFDSIDIFQSVLAIFFVKAIGGAFNLDEPTQLVRLLVTMVRHKLVSRSRERCHQKEMNADLDFFERFPARDASPSHIVSQEELARALRDQLTEEERRIAEERVAGRTWDEIATEIGGTAEGVRKKMDRAVARVRDHFGLDGGERA